MKKIAILTVIALGAGGVYLWSQDSDLRRAFVHHQHLESPEVKAYYPIMGGESFILSERWKNYKKYAKTCPAIAEVVSVAVSKTSDGGDYVITMRGPRAEKSDSGDTCSLWLSGGEVRAFTSY